jgi:hypothetical protein
MTQTRELKRIGRSFFALESNTTSFSTPINVGDLRVSVLEYKVFFFFIQSIKRK